MLSTAEGITNLELRTAGCRSKATNRGPGQRITFVPRVPSSSPSTSCRERLTDGQGPRAAIHGRLTASHACLRLIPVPESALQCRLICKRVSVLSGQWTGEPVSGRGPHRATAGSGQRATDNGQRAADSGRQTADSSGGEHWTAGSGQRIASGRR